MGVRDPGREYAGYARSGAGTAPVTSARRAAGRVRRALTGGVVTVMAVVVRIPAGVRKPILRPLSSWAISRAMRRPETPRMPVLAYVAARGAGRGERAGALAEHVGTNPAANLGTRARLARLALASGQRRVAVAIVATLPDDRVPALEPVRSEIAFEAGRYAEALEHARLARAAGVAGARAIEARTLGHQRVLEPGWLPDPALHTPRLAALSGKAVPGRVLHVVSVSMPHRLAGYTVRTQSVARCQAGVGLDPHVMARTGFPSDAGTGLDVVDGIPYHRVPPDRPTVGPDRLLDAVVRQAVPLLEELRPAVLQPASNHLQAQTALALARPMGIPVVYEVRGFWEESWISRADADEAAAMATDRYRGTREVETAAMLAADAVVTLSEVMRQEIIARGCAPEHVVIVPNAVEVERFNPVPRDDALGASLGIGREDVVAGYISSLNAYEGIPTLLEAAARLRPQVPRLRVLLVGDGDEADSIRDVAHRLGLDDGTLVMPGRVPHDQILGYYSLIDVFVVPRTNHRVSRMVTPLKPYEAMALERAVVVSDLPALREIVQPEATGLTFRAEDADDLAAVLGRLIEDPALRWRLGTQAREWILAERTWEANGRRYRELFERLGVV
jgi:glycosyltransferase involved in cell wall biosynthesis